MNSAPSLRGLKYIAEGSYGRVYAARDDEGVVVKSARNDATRTYLEWVIERTLQGQRMKGMPWVYGLWPEPRNRYRVVMRRYEPLALRFDGPFGPRSFGGPHQVIKEAPPYILQLIAAFEHETGMEANDMHSHNVMQDDDGEWIVLDPAADDYTPLIH